MDSESLNSPVASEDERSRSSDQNHEPNKSLGSRILVSVGAHEFFSPKMWKAALTELIATAGLLFTLTTSIIACLDSHETDPKLLVPLAVFIIAFLFLLVTVPLSGGHMNPIFTFIAALKGLISLSRAIIYIFAQCIGSIICFLIIKTVMLQKMADSYYLGGCVISDLKKQKALLLEFCCAFVVLFLGVTLAFDKKRSKDLGLPMVCVVVAAAMAVAVFVSITVTGQAGYSGVGLNPVRCLGPALLLGGPLWNGQWIFWVGPFLACLLYYAVSINLPMQENLPMQDSVYVGGDGDVFKLGWAKCFAK